MIKIIDGDLCNAKTDIIVHQVNCRGVMGSGVAKAIREKWPFVYEKYKEVCDSINPYKLLGKVYKVALDSKDQQPKYIMNLFGQLNYGRAKLQYTNTEALKKGLTAVYAYALNNNLSVAMPYKIGCGFGGADWNEVYQMINEIFKDVEVELWKL
jgi:O-acetyl-ADP-ribose deacetylase (regulator of RNase III)